MQRAIELALENVASGAGGPFGAVVVRDAQVIGEGQNRVTSACDPTAHAEVQAIRAACAAIQSFQLSACTLYTSCEPCPMCLGAIYWARPERVYFGATKVDAAAIDFDDQFIYQELELPLSDRRIPFEGLMRDEALRAFRAWAESTTKVEY